MFLDMYLTGVLIGFVVRSDPGTLYACTASVQRRAPLPMLMQP